MRIIAAVCLAMLVLPPQVSANPPEDIEISAQGQTVEIFVAHPVQEISHHFIRSIKVSVNSEEAVVQMFDCQSGDGQHVSYVIPGLKAGDQVWVLAVCSIYGQMRKGITVGQ